MKKLFCILMCICVLVALCVMTASAETLTGSCGDNVTWTLDTSTGMLEISGTGAMANYSSYSYVPWYSNHNYIKTVAIGDGVTSIGNYAFYGCSNLTSIAIPDGVTSIGDRVFSSCSSLTNIEIPDGVTSIGYNTFSYCSSLTSITIPDSVTSIAQYAFYECSSLTSITIPDSVTSIGSFALSGCSSLESITLPFVGDSVKTSDDTYQYPFGIVFGTKSYYGSTATSQFYYGSSTSSTTYNTFYIPTSLKEVTITGGNILRGAFDDCSNITSITIPDSVTSIGRLAFYNCSGLTNITIPDSVTSIGIDAFSGCTKLQNTVDNLIYIKTTDNPYFYLYDTTSTSITSCEINENTRFIGDYAFYECSSLTSITIPDSVTSIGSFALSGCSSLESITLPFVGDSVKTSDDTYQYPFGYIFGTSSYTGSTATTQYYYGSSTSSTTYDTYYIPTSLKEVNITGGNILYGAFYNCSSLTSITIGDGVTSIGTSAFSSCNSLTNITIPDSVTSIGTSAFSSCSSLSSITIPDSVTSIGIDAFSSCTKLQNTVDNLIYIKTTDNPYFYLYDTTRISITSCEINENTRFIGNYAFFNCFSLSSITIPDSVTSIGIDAFSACFSLKNITIPDSVTRIDDGAFDGCDNLTIYCYKGSYAETYAIENNIPVEYIGESTEPIQGDFDGDGVVSVKDVLVTIKAVLNGTDLAGADMNGDGKLTLIDVLRVLKLITA